MYPGTWLPAPSLPALSESLGATYLQTRETEHCSLTRSVEERYPHHRLQQNLKNHCLSSSQVQYEQSTFPEAPLSGTGEVPADQEDELTLTGLQEYVEYTVRVRASNGEGYGPFSSPVSVTTYQDGEFFHLHPKNNRLPFIFPNNIFA